MDGGKGLAPRPYHLCGVDLDGGEDADGEAGEDGAEHDVAARVLYLFRHGGDAIEADVGEHGDGSTVEECARGEKLRVVQRHQPRSADRAQDDGICVVWCSVAAQGVFPSIPYAAWVLAFTVVFTALNLRGVPRRDFRIITRDYGSPGNKFSRRCWNPRFRPCERAGGWLQKGLNRWVWHGVRLASVLTGRF